MRAASRSSSARSSAVRATHNALQVQPRGPRQQPRSDREVLVVPSSQRQVAPCIVQQRICRNSQGQVCGGDRRRTGRGIDEANEHRAVFVRKLQTAAPLPAPLHLSVNPQQGATNGDSISTPRTSVRFRDRTRRNLRVPSRRGAARHHARRRRALVDAPRDRGGPARRQAGSLGQSRFQHARTRPRARMVLSSPGLPASARSRSNRADLDGRTALVEVRPAEYQNQAGEVVRRNEVPYDGSAPFLPARTERSPPRKQLSGSTHQRPSRSPGAMTRSADIPF
jgi:hypothetical protein